MKIGDRVKIVDVCWFGEVSPSDLAGKEGTVVGYDPGPDSDLTLVRLDTGEEITCYEDEMELVPVDEQKEVGDA